MRPRSWPLVLALSASALFHLVLAVGTPTRSDRAPALLGTGVGRALGAGLDRLAIPLERRRLVADARRARSAGKLSLGAFVLRASALDLRERARPADEDEALARYRRRVHALEQELGRGVPLASAIPAVFGDLHYDLTEGTAMGALLGGGGNCEALSLLIAAAAHDAGAAVKLRYWGAASPGRPAHLAPVLGRHDLVAGRAAERGGAEFDASELVDRHAALHERSDDQRVPIAPGEESDAQRPFASYPPNRDVYAGEVTLYAERAVAALDTGMKPMPATVSVLDAGLGALPTRCWASLHDLAAPEVEVRVGSGEPFMVELHRLGDASELASDGRELGQFEQALARAEGLDRLLQLACLAIVYDRASVRFAARSKTALANALLLRRQRALREARTLSRELVTPRPTAALERIEQDAEGWMLVVVPELEDALFELAEKKLKGRPSTVLVALLAHSRTRERALRAVDRLPKTTQLTLAMALFFPSYTGHSDSLLGSSGDTELARVARAIAAVPSGSPHEMLDRTGQAIAGAGVDPSWLAAWEELAAASRAVLDRSLP